MAVAVAVISISPNCPPVDNTQNLLIVAGTLTLSGNYGTSGSHGDVINFTNTGDFIKSSQPPERVEIFENPAAGSAFLGYGYIYAQGTTMANGQLMIQGTPAAGGAEVGATEYTQGAAYSAGTPSLAGAVLHFRAWFPSFI